MIRSYNIDDACDAMIWTEARYLFPHLTAQASKRPRLHALRPVNDNTPYHPSMEWR